MFKIKLEFGNIPLTAFPGAKCEERPEEVLRIGDLFEKVSIPFHRLMDSLEVPIFRKTYDLYREFYDRLKKFPKADRYALGGRCEESIAEILQTLFRAGGAARSEKVVHLDRASVQLNMLRIYLRLAKDVRAVDLKAYVALEQRVDEIGRMLGGWRRSIGS